jgi:Phosphotransferase enzyme family
VAPRAVSADDLAGGPTASGEAVGGPASVSRAVDAAVAVAASHGIAATEPRLLADRWNAIVHLAPAPVVARVAIRPALRRDARAALAREVDLAAFLDRAGIPVVPPSTELPPGPHERDGLWLVFHEHVEEDASVPPDVAECGRMLADLHVGLRDYPGPLPPLGPALADVAFALATPEAARFLTDGDLQLLRREHARLAPLLAASAEHPEAQPLHGDPHPGNLLRRADGTLLWNDLEDACRGPVVWDLAVLARSAGAFGEDAALDAYGPHPPREVLEPFAEARTLQGAAWLAMVATGDTRRTEAAARWIAEVRAGPSGTDAA